MKLTGHKTENVYRRYAFVSDADLSEGVAKLAALGVACRRRAGDDPSSERAKQMTSPGER
jgi:hypothetical protein